MASSDLLTNLLRDVSRSFYLTLRVLPAAIRPQIGLAYLLARTTDTIADTELLPVEQRLEALRQLRERILGTGRGPVSFDAFVRAHTTYGSKSGSAAERALLQRIEEAIGLLRVFSPEDQERIRAVLDVIASGQELDLQRFGQATPASIVGLHNKAEFDDYTYRVAGCVGEFWTKMCRAHLFPNAPLDEACLLANGIRFGRGLQMVNILRDLPTDLRAGRCYVPGDLLAQHSLAARNLLSATNEPAFRPVYNGLLAEAQEHLAAGWDYTNALPRRCVRVRLACAWPVLIGVRTLQRLRRENVLDAERRIKISRADVRQVLWRTVASCWWPGAWQRLFQWAVAAG